MCVCGGKKEERERERRGREENEKVKVTCGRVWVGYIVMFGTVFVM